MLSYGSIPLQIPAASEAAFITSKIPIHEAFGFFRPRSFANARLNPRPHFGWFLSRPVKLNSFYHPWGASRFGYAFVLADGKMLPAISEQNSGGETLPFKIDDCLGNSIETDLFMLPPVPLSKIMGAVPQLPLWLLPLVDERYFWWNRSANITVTEGTTTWANLHSQIATGLGVSISVDPISADYVFPGAGLAAKYEYLPLLLDWTASSVGQRIVRRLDGSIAAINPTTATALMAGQVNAYKKYAGGTLGLGVVDG